MTRDETKQILAKLTILYPHFTVGDSVAGFKPTDVWHEMMEDMDFEKVTQALKVCVNKSKYPPTIGEIREVYDEIIASEKKEYYAIKNEFDRCRDYYPGSGTIDNGWKEFQERLTKAKAGMQIEAARYLANKVIGYVHECEKSGTNPIEFAECIRNIEV